MEFYRNIEVFTVLRFILEIFDLIFMVAVLGKGCYVIISNSKGEFHLVILRHL